MKTRIPEIDIIKGLSIYLVVLGHLLDLIGDPAPAINLCHIAAFFFVSGFLLHGSLERHGIGGVLRSKTRGLLIPYLVWSAVSLIANLGLSFIHGGAMTLQAFAAEFTDVFLRGRSVWFLIQLLFAHYVFLMCKKLVKKDGVFWVASIVIYLLLCLILPDNWFQFILFKRLYGFFMAGYAVASLPNLRGIYVKSTVTRILAAVSCTYPLLVWLFFRSGLYAQMNAGALKPLAVLLGMITGGVGVLLICAAATLLRNRRTGDVLAVIGQYSIDVYVMHMFLVKFLPVHTLVARLPVSVTYVFMFVYAAMIVAVIYCLSAYVLRRSRFYCLSVGR